MTGLTTRDVRGSSVVFGLPESPTVGLANRVREMEGRGDAIVKLQTGDPDFSTPDVVVEAAHRAMRDGLTHYASSKGWPSLLETVSDLLNAESGLAYGPSNEIQITHGGVHGVYCSLCGLVGPGDEVLVMDPAWMPYVSATMMAGANPIRVPSGARRGFRPDLDLIADSVTPTTRVIVVNSPCNPSGVVWTDEELGSLRDIAVENDLLVIADEVYEKLVYYPAKHTRLATLEDMRERTVLVNSLSKTYAMSGWRVGYVAAPRDLMDTIMKVSQYTITNLAPFIQEAARTALTHPEASQAVATMRDTYARRLDRIVKITDGDGPAVYRPEGAFYVMIDVSDRYPDAATFAEGLLERDRVCVVPGVGFGACSSGCVRVTFAASDAEIEEGVGRLADYYREGIGV